MSIETYERVEREEDENGVFVVVQIKYDVRLFRFDFDISFYAFYLSVPIKGRSAT